MSGGRFLHAVTGSTIGGRSFQINAEVVGGIVTGSDEGARYRALPVAGKDADMISANLTGMYLSSSFGSNLASGSIIKALNFVMARADAGAEVTWTEVSSALGNASTGGFIDDDFVPKVDSAYDLGTTKTKWRYAYLDAADIDGGAIDNTVIGGTTPAAGTFTTLNANGNVVLGDAAGDTITTTGRFNSTLLPSTDGLRSLGSSLLGWAEVYADVGLLPEIRMTTLKASNGTAAGSIDTSGVVTLAESVLTTTDINGGSVDGVTIGSNSAATALVVNAGVNIDDDGDGAIDGCVIGGATPAAGTFTALTANDSLAVNANATITGDSAGEIQLLVTAHATQTADVFVVEAQDGTDRMKVDKDGLVTITSVDINGGNIDGTTIGSVSPAAGNFSTVQASTSISSNGTITGVGLTSSYGIQAGAGGQFRINHAGVINQAAASNFLGASTFGSLGSSTLFIAGNDASGASKLYRLAVSGGILRAEQQ